MTSEQINELATALAKAQGKITGALKDSANPFFKSKYADLAACWDACREALSENGLSIVQTTMRGEPVTIKWSTTDKESGEISDFSADTHEVVIVTTLLHASGQWIRGTLALIPRDLTPQGFGSVITYGRRYGLTAIVGVAQVDDDGNAASGRSAVVTTGNIHSPKPDGWNRQDTAKVTEYVKRIIAAVNEGKDVLELTDELTDEVFKTAVWSALPAPVKNYIRTETEKRRP